MKKEEIEKELLKEGKKLISTNECLCENSQYYYFDVALRARRCACCCGVLDRISRIVESLPPKKLIR